MKISIDVGDPGSCVRVKQAIHDYTYRALPKTSGACVEHAED